MLLENYFLPGDLRAPDRKLRGALQSRALPRESQQRHARRCLLRPRTIYFKQKRKDQRENYKTPTLAIPQSRRLISTNMMSKVSLSLAHNLCQII